MVALSRTLRGAEKVVWESKTSELDPQEIPLGSQLTWDSISSKTCMSDTVDKEKLRPLLTCMSPSSTYVFTHVLLDSNFHLDPRISKTFSLYEETHKRNFKVI